MGLLDLLPLAIEDPDEGCIRPSEDMFCFRTGDPRVNEQTVLCIIHTIMIRNHNLIARELGKINPHWSDETLYQEARHINIAIIQHITFNEYLPLLLGKDNIHKHGLVLYMDGYYDGYDEKIDPSNANGFASAAYRFGHSLLPSTVERWSHKHQFVMKADLAKIGLTTPVCTEVGEKIALSRRIDKHWRLIGWGQIRRGITVKPTERD